MEGIAILKKSEPNDILDWPNVMCGADPAEGTHCTISDRRFVVGLATSIDKQYRRGMQVTLAAIVVFVGADIYFWLTSHLYAGLLTWLAVIVAVGLSIAWGRWCAKYLHQYDLDTHELSGRRVKDAQWEFSIMIEPRQIQLTSDRVILCFTAEEVPSRMVLMAGGHQKVRHALAVQLAELLQVAMVVPTEKPIRG
jgi:hypothetical protein